MTTVNKFKKFGIMCLAIMLLVAVGYAYLNYNIKPVEIDSENEPYGTETENCGLILDINNEKTFFYLNFKEEKIEILLNVPQNYKNDIHGYSADYTVTSENTLVSELIDRIGGIDLNLEAEEFCYTGVQILDLLKENKISKREVVLAVFSKIGQVGLESRDFIFIIENCETNIKIPDCYYWPKYIKSMCQNIKIID